jgi:ribosomal protein S18 acetylase RimI-like enzyme
VLSSQQGKGTGKFMIEEIMKMISEKNASALRLNVNRYNKAKSFYEKLGFEVIGSEDINIGGGFYMNDYVMEKRLGTTEVIVVNDSVETKLN